MSVIAIIEIILAVISLALGIYSALQKPPEPPVPLPDGIAQIPVAEQGNPIPVVFGVRAVKKPNIVWWGDPKNKPNQISP